MNTPHGTASKTTGYGLWRIGLLLAAILLVGAYVRLLSLAPWHTTGYTYHPEEQFFVFYATHMQLPPDVHAYFNSNTSPAHPHQVVPNGYETAYHYSSIPLLLTRCLAEWWHVSAASFLLVGRTVAVLFDMMSLLLVYGIGARIYGKRTGIVAMALSACMVLHIQQAHFFTAKPFATFFVLFTLYWLVRGTQQLQHRAVGRALVAFVGAGVGSGMAVASDVSLLWLVVFALVAPLLSLPHQPTTTKHPSPHQHPSRLRWFFMLPCQVVMVLAALVTLRMAQPAFFIGSPTLTTTLPALLNSILDVRLSPLFLDNVWFTHAIRTGEIDYPLMHQWVGRTPYVRVFTDVLLWGMGPVAGTAAAVSWGAVAIGLLRSGMRYGDNNSERHAALSAPPFVTRGTRLLWLWITLYGAARGGAFASSMAEMLPIVAPLALLAAWGVQALAHKLHTKMRSSHASSVSSTSSSPSQPAISSKIYQRFQPLLVPGLLGLLVAGTWFWAYSFIHIYRQPHSYDVATRWLLQDAPPNATVLWEWWNTPLPLDIEGDYVAFANIQYKKLYTWTDDTSAKYICHDADDETCLINQLDNATYITLNSDLVYRSLSHLPARYPVAIRFYQALLRGNMGFELVADIHSSPSFMGVDFNDEQAEIGFRLYDHPRVLIFRKAAYSHDAVVYQLTHNVQWEEIAPLPARVADAAPTGLRFTANAWQTYKNTWLALYDRSRWVNANAIAPLVWLVVMEAIGWATFVLLFRLFPQLPDGGFALARPLGWLLVGYAAWVCGSWHVLSFSPRTVWACAAPLLIVGAWVALRSRNELRRFWHRAQTPLLVGYALYLLAFSLMVLVRWYNPDLWHPWRGGEKPMEFAQLQAVLRSESFPPADPWLAGGYINYYYFGVVLVGTLIHLTTVMPSIGFNLAIPTLFSLTALGAWGVVYNLLSPARNVSIRSLVSAVLAACLVLIPGNLVQALWFFTGYAAQQTHRPEWAFWDATRIVEGTINEFPFFTFLFADMHPHMMVLPFSLCLLGLTVVLARCVSRRIHTVRFVVLLLLIGFVLGALHVTNTWDVPTYGSITLITLALVMGRVHRAERVVRGGASVVPLFTRFGGAVALMVSVSYIAFLPFHNHFATESSGVMWWRDVSQSGLWAQLWHAPHTTTREWLLLYGMWLFIAVSGAMVWLVRRRTMSQLRVLALLTMVGIVALAWLCVRHHTDALVLLVPLCVGALFLVRAARRLPPRLQLPVWWGAVAIALSVGIELVVVRGDVGRMNTVFKFGMHIWTLFALVAGVTVPWVWHWLGTSYATNRRVWWVVGAWAWRGALLLLLCASLVYPITATPARIADRFDDVTVQTLDGMAFLVGARQSEEGHEFALFNDYAVITWLQQTVRGVPIILEAHQPSYRWGGRIATFTGLPTLLGWEWHETQQRGAAARFADDSPLLWQPKSVTVMRPQSLIESRKAAVALIYNTHNASTTYRLLREYGVQFVVVGGVERALYDAAGVAKFADMAATNAGLLSHAFCSGNTCVYAVNTPTADVRTSATNIPDATFQIRHATKRYIPPLLLAQRVNRLPDVGNYAWNDWGNADSWHAVVVWLVMLWGLVLLGVPLALLLFAQWHDGGWVWARMVALLLLGYGVWLPVSFHVALYTMGTLAMAIVTLVVFNVALIAWAGRTPGAVFAPVRSWSLRRGAVLLAQQLWHKRHTILINEGIFLVAWCFFVFVRAQNPDVWHPIWGGEKPMETGLLHAMLHSPVMPPYSPFYSDGIINYYYYGFFLLSLLIKATGIDVTIAFNIILPLLFAQTLVAGVAIVRQLTGKLRYGLLGGVLLACVGNLASVLKVGWSQGIRPIYDALFVRDVPSTLLARLLNIGTAIGDWYIGPSRVITEPFFTINEFPYWSFLYADLHPHMIALPIALLLIAFAYTLLIAPRQNVVALWVWGGFTVGALAVTNSWDVPTYALLFAAAMMGRTWRVLPAAKGITHTMLHTVATGIAAFVVILGGLALYEPFFAFYHAVVGGIGTVKDYTAIQDYLILYGLFLAIVLPLIVGAAWHVMGTLACRTNIVLPLLLPSTDNSSLPTPVISQNAEKQIVQIVGTTLVGMPFVAGLVGVFGRKQCSSHTMTTKSRRLGRLVGAIVFGVPLIAGVVGFFWQRNRKTTRNVQYAKTTTTPFAAKTYRIVSRAPGCFWQSVVFGGQLALVLLGGLLVRVALQSPDTLALRAWLVCLLFVSGALLLPRRSANASWFALLLITLAWAVSLGIEMVFIRDHLQDGDYYRMNTVFKFGMHIWTLLALGAAAGLPLLLRGLRHGGKHIVHMMLPAHASPHLSHTIGMVAHVTWLLLLTPLFAATLIFPLIGTPSRIANRFTQPNSSDNKMLSLDGFAFMRYGDFFYENSHVQLRPDWYGISWLKHNLRGTPIVLQSGLWFYRTYGIRVAALTGLPTIVSALHENEQRNPAYVGKRDSDMDAIYRTTDAALALQLLAKYHVNYIYVGSVEHAFYPPEGLEKFTNSLQPFLEEVFASPGVAIYRFLPEEDVYVDAQAYRVPVALPSHETLPTLFPTAPPVVDAPQDIPSHIAYLERIIDTSPTDIAAVLEVVTYYRDTHRLEEVVRILQKVIPASPNDIYLYHIMGDVWAEMGRRDMAEHVYREAATISGKSADWDKLGRELLTWGKLDAAEDALVQGLTIEPVDPPLHYHLGLLYAIESRNEAARQHVERYLLLEPSGRFAGEARALLNRLTE